MTFPEFLNAIRTGTINKDVAWRAYDIENAVRPRHVRGALKRLGMTYAGELALPEACARYDLGTGEARVMLGAWWLWSGIDAGRAMGVPLRRNT